MEDLERYWRAGLVPGEKDPGVAPFADLAFDVIEASEGLAHQRQHVAPDDLLLWSTSQWLPSEAGGASRCTSQEDVASHRPPDPPPERSPEIGLLEGNSGPAGHAGAPEACSSQTDPSLQ